MMHCQTCDSQTEVTDTREVRSEGMTRRRRVCKVCGFKFTTYEMPAEKISQALKEQAVFIHAIQDAQLIAEIARRLHEKGQQ